MSHYNYGTTAQYGTQPQQVPPSYGMQQQGMPPQGMVQPTYQQQPQQNSMQYQENIYMTDPTVTPVQPVPPAPQPGNPQFSPQQIAIESQLQNEKPTAPTLLFSQNGQSFGLPVKFCQVSNDFHIGTMFGYMVITFVNNTNQKLTATFAFPTEGTVTSCDVQIGTNRYMGTTYVTNEDANKHLNSGRNRGNGVGDDPNARYVPDLFRCPVNNINPQDEVKIEINWLQSVEYIQGRYQYRLPLRFGPNILPVGLPVQQVVHIEANINCASQGIRFGSASHNLLLQSNVAPAVGAYNSMGRTQLVASPLPQNQTSVDFHIAYTVQTNEISSRCIIAPPEQNSWDNRGSFVTFVNPPMQADTNVPRDIIFLMDRSGSMAGQPWEFAARALQEGLNTLRQGDRFGIVMFDHEASFFNGTGRLGTPNLPPQYALYIYSEQTRAAAAQFIQSNPAKGATNIKTPLLWAVDTLNMNRSTDRIPFVVLLTDGAVKDEKDIVKSVREKHKGVRVLTFGIGQHCNWYFLKMLALETRGWSSGSISPETLGPKMTTLIDRAGVPVLTNVEAQFANVRGLEQYPQHIPDLFVGGPLIIAGKYSGNAPSSVKILGTIGEQKVQLDVPIVTSDVVPVAKVFVKQQLDELIARHWMDEKPEVKDQIVNISLNEQLPTPHTTMIAYEMDEKQKQKLEAEEKKQNKKKKKKQKKKGPSAGTIAKYAGGAVALTAGAVLLGSVAMTMSGGSGFASIGDVGGLDMGDAFGGGCCGDCGCIADICDSCACFGDIFGEIGGVCADCCADIGGCFGDVIGGLGDVCGEIGSACAECPIEEICTGCVDILSSILDAI